MYKIKHKREKENSTGIKKPIVAFRSKIKEKLKYARKFMFPLALSCLLSLPYPTGGGKEYRKAIIHINTEIYRGNRLLREDYKKIVIPYSPDYLVGLLDRLDELLEGEKIKLLIPPLYKLENPTHMLILLSIREGNRIKYFFHHVNKEKLLKIRRIEKT